MNLKPANEFPTGGQLRAFSRVDLLALIFTITLVVAWVGITHVGAIGRQVRCASNLSALGKAMHEYANEHDDGLPAASINWGSKQSSWDLKLLPYLMPGLAKANSGEMFAQAPRWLVCPSDISGNAAQGRTPRSYAMPVNDMTGNNWPPSPDSATGVGLDWNGGNAAALAGPDATPEKLPAVKLSSVTDPAHTALLTELIDPNNRMGSYQAASVWNSAQQQAFFNANTNFDYCHGGEFNYLMVDGHVERLSALQTGSLGSGAGIWSIRKGD
jgi:prepilin-type processing-associated H-X9-DG protein